MSWITSLLGQGIAEPIAKFFTRKAELAQARFEARLAAEKAKGERQAALIMQGLTADMNWEMEFARQAATSWKDEYTLIVVSVPAILCFVPGGSAIVASGFDALSKAPLWYQGILITLFLATVGIRYWRRSQYDTESFGPQNGGPKP